MRVDNNPSHRFLPFAFGLQSAALDVEVLHSADVSWLWREFHRAALLHGFDYRIFDFLHSRIFIAGARSGAERVAQEILHLRERVAA